MARGIPELLGATNGQYRAIALPVPLPSLLGTIILPLAMPLGYATAYAPTGGQIGLRDDCDRSGRSVATCQPGLGSALALGSGLWRCRSAPMFRQLQRRPPQWWAYDDETTFLGLVLAGSWGSSILRPTSAATLISRWWRRSDTFRCFTAYVNVSPGSELLSQSLFSQLEMAVFTIIFSILLITGPLLCPSAVAAPAPVVEFVTCCRLACRASGRAGLRPGSLYSQPPFVLVW